MRVLNGITCVLPGSTRGRTQSGPSNRANRGAESSRVTRVGVKIFPADLGHRQTELGDDGNGSGGNGGFNGGGGGGGDSWGCENGDDRSRSLGIITVAIATALVPSFIIPKSAIASDKTDTTSSPSDLGVCFLYGFTWFYGVKLFLKTLFSPLVLFFGTMFLLTKAGVLPESLGREAYEGYVKPRIPKEWKKDLQSPIEDGVEDKVRKFEKQFWKFVKRVLPACSTTTAEKAFFAGIILAGLA